VLALIVAAGWALFHRPAPTPPPPRPQPTVSAMGPPPPVASSDPASLPPPAIPSVDPDSKAPPPIPIETCPAGLTRVDATIEGKQGHGCAAHVGDAGLRKEGLWVLEHPNHQISAGTFVDDHREGVWTTWYADGSKAMAMPYVAGFPEGTQIEWLPSGQTFAKRTYKHGVLDGPAVLTRPDGTTMYELWKDGHRIEPAPL
jgi:hypothetical protein